MKQLIAKDANYLLDIIYESRSCDTKESFVNLFKSLSNIFPYSYSTCVFRREAEGELQYEVLNLNYPDEWFELYISKKFFQIDPIIQRNFEKYDTQYWSDTYKERKPPKDFLDLAEDFGLKKGYTSGKRNLKDTEGSLFSFAGPAMGRSWRHEKILHYVIPHLHQVFARITEKPALPPAKNPLTKREKEVLKWISCGKSSWDISIILGISERTVNFHAGSIMQKLDAVSRLHAVAIAFEKKLIDID
jgi:LuxR family transcriptional regulator, quorum-sensing system regulator CviR